MTSIRIKVQIGDEKKPRTKDVLRKFVYVIQLPSQITIGELIRKLQEYIVKRFSRFNLQIVELKTYDGFILSKSDSCADVFKDNDHIICVDMTKFIDEYHVSFEDKTILLEYKQYDANINREKSIKIGLNNVSELFIRIFGTLDHSGLYIFGIDELIRIASEKHEGK